MSRSYDFDDEEPYVVIEKQSGTLSSFLVGLAIGAGVALLFAPQSGAQTRRGIQRRARRAQRAARRWRRRHRHRRRHVPDARRRVEERIDSARQAIEVKKEQVHRAMEAGRAAAQQAREELERRIAETKAAYQTAATAATSAGRGRSVAPRAAGRHREWMRSPRRRE